jgi:hypothetical protein
MTELSFLLDLLLNHKLPKPTREAVTARVKEVEVQLQHPQQQLRPIGQVISGIGQVIPPHLVGQAPSTIAAMMRHGDAPPAAPPAEVPAPVAIVGQTPAAQAALLERQAAIAGAISGKPEKGRTSPRKF